MNLCSDSLREAAQDEKTRGIFDGEPIDGMAWVLPKFSRSQVDKAGAILAKATEGSYELSDALEVIQNWRSSHGLPLNTFQLALRRTAEKLNVNSVVAQRLKRLESIQSKLVRQPRRLSQIQDIGGCRAVLDNFLDLAKFHNAFINSGRRHEMIHCDDYLATPKTDVSIGRLHLIYRYKSDRTEDYNNHKIEIQLPTQWQHAWATAVEIVDMMLNQSLKIGKGDPKWKRFFVLMSNEIASMEGLPLVKDAPFHWYLTRELRQIESELKVQHHLKSFQVAFQSFEETSTDAHTFLLTLTPGQSIVTIRGYKRDELAKANDDYLAVERKILDGEAVNAVLVSARSLAQTRRAYPNYFMDTKWFLRALREALQRALPTTLNPPLA